MSVGGRGIDRVAESLKLKHVCVERFGEDFMVSGYTKEQACLPVS